MNVTTVELTAADFEAEFGDELPGRDLMICLPVVVFTLVGGVVVSSTSVICVGLGR